MQDLPLILLLVLTIALAMTILVYRHDLSIAKSRVATGSEVLRGPDSTIEFADRGEGDVVMVAHRSGGGFDQGIAMTQHLPALGFRVVAPSRAGYLRSSCLIFHCYLAFLCFSSLSCSCSLIYLCTIYLVSSHLCFFFFFKQKTAYEI